jgi:cytochrome c553
MFLSRRNKFCFLLVIPLALFSIPGMSGDIEKGKTKAELCQGCHGVDGISVSSIIPNLAGQKEEYLIVSLKAFKRGSRKNGIMSSVAATISNDDIADISAYYSNLTMGKASE